MTYYIIKTHYIPSPTNNRADAVEHDWFTGKAGFTMNTENFKNIANNSLCDCPYYLNYAYTRLCDARRALKVVQENNAWETGLGHWNVSSEIITIER